MTSTISAGFFTSFTFNMTAYYQIAAGVLYNAPRNLISLTKLKKLPGKQ